MQWLRLRELKEDDDGEDEAGKVEAISDDGVAVGQLMAMAGDGVLHRIRRRGREPVDHGAFLWKVCPPFASSP